MLNGWKTKPNRHYSGQSALYSERPLANGNIPFCGIKPWYYTVLGCSTMVLYRFMVLHRGIIPFCGMVGLYLYIFLCLHCWSRL